MELKQAQEQFDAMSGCIKAYEYALSLADWDVMTLSPKKGKEGAARAMGILSGELFSLKVSPEMRAVLETFEKNRGELTPVQCRELELLQEEIEKLDKIPKKEYQEYAELQSVTQYVWEEAKQQSDYKIFAPYLEKVLAFNKRFAKLTKPDMHPYNACLDDYEKGVSMEELDNFFGAIRKKTVPLVARIAREGRSVRSDFLSRTYPVEMQEQVAYRLIDHIGFDREAGVLAASEHPFTAGISRGNVRLTTHYYSNNLTSSILSVAHEAGHGIYEQNAKNSPMVEGSLLDSGVSMSIHESQSRFYENTICRSRGFWEYFYPVLQETYPDQLADVDAEALYRAINRAQPSLIRIEADELTYNLHIMVRYELERELMEENISISDLPRLWNEKYEEYLGLTPTSDKVGVLQDVHWAGGMFGYFPSYALGNAYAAQIRATMEKELNLDALCRAGNLAPITAWLNEKIHQYGKLKRPSELIVDISGEPLNPSYLTSYLEEKFGDIYF